MAQIDASNCEVHPYTAGVRGGNQEMSLMQAARNYEFGSLIVSLALPDIY